MVTTRITNRPAGQPEQDGSRLSLPKFQTDIYADIELANRADRCKITFLNGSFIHGKLLFLQSSQECVIRYGEDRSINVRLDQILSLSDFEMPPPDRPKVAVLAPRQLLRLRGYRL